MPHFILRMFPEKVGALLFVSSHPEITYVVTGYGKSLECRDALFSLRSLTADADEKFRGIFVPVYADHLPVVAVKREIARNRMGVTAYLEINRLGGVYDIVVVVIAGADSSDADDTVLAMVAMLETEFLPKILIGVDEESSGIV